mmetsp:Transcript_3214/g.5358  ORF Transcript_3214/g.5358 Transcript_3214/m.5358 type:complete len:345 (-) Transcript_3214:641-1675(-)
MAGPGVESGSRGPPRALPLTVGGGAAKSVSLSGHLLDVVDDFVDDDADAGVADENEGAEEEDGAQVGVVGPVLLAELDLDDGGDQVAHGGGDHAAQDGDDLADVGEYYGDEAGDGEEAERHHRVEGLRELLPLEDQLDEVLPEGVVVHGVGHHDAHHDRDDGDQQGVVSLLARQQLPLEHDGGRLVELAEVAGDGDGHVEGDVDEDGPVDHLVDALLLRVDQLRVDGQQLDLARVGEEGHRAAHEDVEVPVGGDDLALLAELLVVGGQLHQQHHARVEQRADAGQADVAEGAHVPLHGEGEEEDEGGGDGLVGRERLALDVDRAVELLVDVLEEAGDDDLVGDA